jgi:hypothetical protein
MQERFLYLECLIHDNGEHAPSFEWAVLAATSIDEAYTAGMQLDLGARQAGVRPLNNLVIPLQTLIAGLGSQQLTWPTMLADLGAPGLTKEDMARFFAGVEAQVPAASEPPESLDDDAH